MAGKSPDRQTWKTDRRVAGQFKQLEKEQKELLKQFSRYQAEQEGYLAQKKTMTGIQAYKCFYETFDRLAENRSDQLELLKPKYQDPFASDTKRMLDEKRKIFGYSKKCLIWTILFLGEAKSATIAQILSNTTRWAKVYTLQSKR